MKNTENRKALYILFLFVSVCWGLTRIFIINKDKNPETETRKVSHQKPVFKTSPVVYADIDDSDDTLLPEITDSGLSKLKLIDRRHHLYCIDSATGNVQEIVYRQNNCIDNDSLLLITDESNITHLVKKKMIEHSEFR